MSYVDLKTTLREWPYDPDQISVRKILGADGEIRIQMRVELGILQMEAEGRPDGVRPHGCPSLVDYHLRRLPKESENGNGNGQGEFELSTRECRALRDEASVYYRRYVALFVLEEFESVARDTAHTLCIFDLCRDYGAERDDRECLERYRPYVMMMNARAQAYQALQEGEPTSALAHVKRGILNIQAHYEERGDDEAMRKSEELRMLRNLVKELADQIPEDSLIATRRALRQALDMEHFEEAARLRDVLRKRYGQTP